MDIWGFQEVARTFNFPNVSSNHAPVLWPLWAYLWTNVDIEWLTPFCIMGRSIIFGPFLWFGVGNMQHSIGSTMAYPSFSFVVTTFPCCSVSLLPLPCHDPASAKSFDLPWVDLIYPVDFSLQDSISLRKRWVSRLSELKPRKNGSKFTENERMPRQGGGRSTP